MLKIGSACRLNIIISGGTGSGKTTMLNAMSQLIDPAERVVTIEDAAELQLQQPHVVRLETRPPNLEGTGEITMRDLVKNALRMRPDRIICGEVRGPEALDMLQAMNTGHDGSMCTLHSNNPREALTRMENMIGMASVNLPSKAVRTQIVGAVNLIVQVSRMRDGVRRVTHVTEIIGMEGEVVTTQDLFNFEFQGESRDGTLIGQYKSSGVRPHFTKRAAYFGLERALQQAMMTSARSSIGWPRIPTSPRRRSSWRLWPAPGSWLPSGPRCFPKASAGCGVASISCTRPAARRPDRMHGPSRACAAIGATARSPASTG